MLFSVKLFYVPPKACCLLKPNKTVLFVPIQRREMELGSKRTEKEVEFSENKIKEVK